MHILFYFAVILLAGMIMAKIVSKLNLPHVTGYLIGGIIIGSSVLKIIPSHLMPQLSIIPEMALGFIAYGIGGELNFQNLKHTGKNILLITIFQSVGAALAVILAMMILFRQSLAFSLVLASIATATAPAATVMVIQQYKARGPLVDTLLPVVAIDDAICVIMFGFALAIAEQVTASGQNMNILLTLLLPLGEVLLSLLLGAIIGIILSFVSNKVKGNDELLCVTIATIFLAIGLSEIFHLSTLLVCIMLGTTITNISPNSLRTLSVIDSFTSPIFIMFFTIAGIQLDVSALKGIGFIGIGYIIIRALGKIGGTYVGAKITNAPKTIQKYLGLTLIPQAGVAIGLSMIAETALPKFGSQIKAIILAATIVYELFGPVITKIALMRAGEIPAPLKPAKPVKKKQLTNASY